MDCGLASLMKAVSLQKSKESSSCSVGCLSLSSVNIGIPKKSIRTPVKEYTCNRVDELASESEDKQANSKNFLPSCSLMWAATRQCGPDLGWVFPLQINEQQQQQKIPHRCAQFLGFQLTLDVAKLTTMMSHHSIILFTDNDNKMFATHSRQVENPIFSLGS